ncbi:hypothetical protein CK203_111792 [Vitis vinifera]|uniref:Uncharacterized protein n=1 Tax=Vitis vinifera TaxID=29760 RepID=A0A438D4G7_VITVI|nr:hypothetical protein CK203_111792 [Vitis vinifera]
MGLGISPGLLMLVAFFWLPWLSDVGAQSTGSARALDALLQDYAYQAFKALNKPKTGIPYDGAVPLNLTGIGISALRLRSGSLRSRGNLSSVYYPLPGYAYLAPVLGLLPYDASNLSATNLPELHINASDKPISIKFQGVSSVPAGSVAKCVWFDLDGFPNFSNAVSGNICSTAQQGHFGIVVESNAPAPSPPPSVVPSPSGGEKGGTSKVWIIVGSVVGGLALLVLLAFLVLWLRKYKRRKKMQQMEKAAEVGEALRMTSVGNTKAPAAMVTRTQPIIENEYMP